MGRRVAVYARASTLVGSTRVQVEVCRAYCARQGHTILGEYVDDLASLECSPTQFERLCLRAVHGDLEAVVCYAPELLIGSPGDLAVVANTFIRRGIAIDCILDWVSRTSCSKVTARVPGDEEGQE